MIGNTADCHGGGAQLPAGSGKIDMGFSTHLLIGKKGYSLFGGKNNVEIYFREGLRHDVIPLSDIP